MDTPKPYNDGFVEVRRCAFCGEHHPHARNDLTSLVHALRRRDEIADALDTARESAGGQAALAVYSALREELDQVTDTISQWGFVLTLEAATLRRVTRSTCPKVMAILARDP